MDLGGIFFSLNSSGLVFLLDGVDLARQRPRSTGDLLAQDLSGHAQVIGRVHCTPVPRGCTSMSVTPRTARSSLSNVCAIGPAGRPVATASRAAISATAPWLPWAWNAATVLSMSALTSSGSAPTVLARGWLRVRKTAHRVAGAGWPASC